MYTYKPLPFLGYINFIKIGVSNFFQCILTLAQVEDKCKMQKRFIEYDNPIITLDYLCNL